MVSPELAAFLTLSVVVVAAGGLVMWRMTNPPVTARAFRPEPRTPRHPPRVLQLRITSTPPGATVAGPEGLSGTTPFLVDVPNGEPLPLRFSLPGHEPLERTFNPARAQEFHVDLVPLAARADAGVP